MKHSFVDAFRYKAWANREILRLGSSQFDRLPPDDRTYFLRILNHTSVVDALFVARLQGRSAAFESDNTVQTPTLGSLRIFMSQTDTELIAISECVEDLGQWISFTFTDGERGRMTVAEGVD